MRIWIDSTGWSLLTGKFPPEMDTMNTWGNEDKWTGLLALLEKVTPHGSVELVLSPEFFVFFRDEQGSSIPAELAQRRLGLSPEAWVLRSQLLGDQIHVTAIPREVASHLEQFCALWPETLTILLVPLKLDLEEPHLVIFGNQSLLAECDGDGVTRHWNWVPEDAYPDETAQIALETLLEQAGSWMAFESVASLSYAQLKKTRQFLFKVLVALVLVGLLIWWRWLVVEKDFNQSIQSAQAYLDTHREEARQIDVIQARGDIAWEKLKEIQDFSNRQSPIANTIAALANLTETQVAWKQFFWNDHEFTLVLTGPNMNVILDAIDKIREMENLNYLRFEELKSQARTKKLEVKIEGGFS